MEILLHDKQEHIRSLIEDSLNHIVRYDRDYRHVVARGVATTATDSDFARYIGKTHREVGVPGHLCDLFESAIDTVFETGQPQQRRFAWRGTRGDSLLEWFAFPDIDLAGRVDTVLGIAHDITERERAERALRDSEAKLRTLFDLLPVGVTVLDRDRKVIDANAALEQILDLRREDLIAGTYRRRRYIRPDGRPITAAEYPTIRAAKEGGPVHDVEIGIVKEDEDIVWTSVSAAPLPDGRVVAVTTDVTERKRMQAKLLESQKMDSIGNLAGGIAHDFNNMLAGISGYASLLQRMATDPRQRRYVDGILTSTRKAAELTRKLLAFGRRGKGLVTAVDLNRVVGETITILERTIHPGIQVDTELADGLCCIDGDPSQMSQVVMNLCVNAVEAMPRRGRLSFATRNHRPDDSFRENHPGSTAAHYVLLEVSDSGMGMPEEVRQKIFEPFFTTKTGEGTRGTGLGLAVVHGVIKNHGGEIEVDTQPGRGTTFRLYFPCGSRDWADAAVARRVSISGGGLILVVEDEEEVRIMAGEMLTTMGFEVISAADGKEAVEMFRARHADIAAVLLDLRMPRLSGREAFMQMKAIDPRLRVVISSGHGDGEEEQELIEMGAKSVCPKPYTTETLSLALAEALAASL